VCWSRTGPATIAQLNASNSAVDAALLATNHLASRTIVVNASIRAVGDNVTGVLAARGSSDRQISRLNDRCEYCRPTPGEVTSGAGLVS